MAEPYVPQPSLYQKVRYVLEAALIFPVFYLFKLIPYKVSSALIGKLVVFFGQYHSANKIALQNIREAFPDKSPEEVKEIAQGAWKNLGRTAGELVAITGFSEERMKDICEVTGFNFIEETLSNSKNKNAIFISAHIGNWEVSSRMLCEVVPDMALIYRHANNPYVEKLIQDRRGAYTDFIIKKGSKSGFRDIYAHVKKGGNLGLLADQKTREGVNVEFFKKSVRAVSTPADLALKFDIKILMGRNIRKENQKFELRFEPPIETKDKTSQQIMQEVYNIYEKWISEYPTQWFWMHNRWYIGRKPYLV